MWTWPVGVVKGMTIVSFSTRLRAWEYTALNAGDDEVEVLDWLALSGNRDEDTYNVFSSSWPGDCACS